MNRRHIGNWILGMVVIVLTLTLAPGQTIVQNCAMPAPNLVGWWPGDGNANDIKGGNNGTLENGVTFAPGMVDQAFYFNGDHAYVKVPKAPELDMTDEVTVSFWMKADVDNPLTDCQGLVTTDTVPARDWHGFPVKTLSVADLLGEGILRIHSNQSVTSLFKV